MTIQAASVASTSPVAVLRLPDLIDRALKRSVGADADARRDRRSAGGVVDPDDFAAALQAAFDRSDGDCLASIWLVEMPHLAHRFGGAFVFERVTELISLAYEHLAPSDVFTVAEDGELAVLARAEGSPIDRVEQLCRAIAGGRVDEHGGRIGLTPIAGVVALGDGSGPAEVLRRAIAARAVAIPRRDGRVQRWEPTMSEVATRATTESDDLPSAPENEFATGRPQPATRPRHPADAGRLSHAAIARIAARVTTRSAVTEMARLAAEREPTTVALDAEPLPRRQADADGGSPTDLPRRQQ